MITHAERVLGFGKTPGEHVGVGGCDRRKFVASTRKQAQLAQLKLFAALAG
jgi:hypothetical protein